MTVADRNKDIKLFDNTSTLQFESAGPGDYVTFPFDVLEASEYELDLKPYRSTDYGTFNVMIDGSLLRGQFLWVDIGA